MLHLGKLELFWRRWPGTTLAVLSSGFLKVAQRGGKGWEKRASGAGPGQQLLKQLVVQGLAQRGAGLDPH